MDMSSLNHQNLHKIRFMFVSTPHVFDNRKFLTMIQSRYKPKSLISPIFIAKLYYFSTSLFKIPIFFNKRSGFSYTLSRSSNYELNIIISCSQVHYYSFKIHVWLVRELRNFSSGVCDQKYQSLKNIYSTCKIIYDNCVDSRSCNIIQCMENAQIRSDPLLISNF